jgi:hypothetical protein
MSQTGLGEWVGSDQAKGRECSECATPMERRARTMADYRPWECPECGHRQ